MASEADYEKYGANDDKKGRDHSPRRQSVIVEEDYEVHTKKDCPPRFSTLFDTKPVTLPPRQVEDCSRRKRKSGVFIPMPLFIVLALAIFFESTLLFAYTIIGLYNNLPSRLTPGGHSTLAAGCDYAAADRQAPVNIAPNIFMGPGSQATVTETVTLANNTAHAVQLSTSMTVSAETSSSAGTTSSTSATITSASVSLVTVTPGGGTVTSMILVTESGDNPTTSARSTSFTTLFVQPSVLSAQHSTSTSSTTDATKDSKETTSVAPPSSTQPPSSTTSSPASAQSSTAPPSTTAPPPVTSSTSSSVPPASSTSKANSGLVCIGGAGAVQQNCQSF